MASIIQWNCNGCKTHYCELKEILVQNSPICVCLQETHFKVGENFSLRGYKCSRKDVIHDLRARGGVAIYTKENIPITPIPVQTELQAVAIRTEFPVKMTICNIYLPNFDWEIQDWRDIVAQLPRPYIIMGDFNAHNPLWGSERLDTRGRIIEDLIDELELIILNTGEGTYLNSRSNSFSAIDLTLCSPEIAHIFEWKRLGGQLYTDHFPILIKCAAPNLQNVSPKKMAAGTSRLDSVCK